MVCDGGSEFRDQVVWFSDSSGMHVRITCGILKYPGWDPHCWSFLFRRVWCGAQDIYIWEKLFNDFFCVSCFKNLEMGDDCNSQLDIMELRSRVVAMGWKRGFNLEDFIKEQGPVKKTKFN